MKFILLTLLALLFASCNYESEDSDVADEYFSNNKPSENTITFNKPSMKTYTQGEVISMSITHPSNLTVTGTPQVSLDIGGASVFATYTSGSGTDTLTFEYTVLANQLDTDGIEVIGDVDLNGGTIDFDKNGVVTPSQLTIGTQILDSVFVDAQIPSATSVNATAVPLSTLYLDQVIDMAVVFDEPVVVSGSPYLDIDIGGTTKQLSYVSGGGTSILFFRGSVTNTDLDLNGFEFQAIQLNGGTIQDSAGNNSDNTGVSGFNTSINIDGDTPYVKTVIPPTDGTYTPGQTLSLSLEFTELVNITGSPRIEIVLDSGSIYATYASGSGSDTLTFDSIVSTGNVDIDGIQIQNIIDLNSGTIQDATSNNALLILDSPATPNILIDGVLPEVITILPPADGFYSRGEELYFTLTFNDEVDITGTPQIGIQLNSSTPTPVYAQYSSGSGTQNIIFRYVISDTDVDMDGITLDNAIDLNGGLIQNDSITNANLDLTTALTGLDLSNIILNGADIIPPAIISVTPPIDKNYVTGETIEFTVNFDEAVIVENTPQVEFDIGTTVNASYSSGSGSTSIVFAYTVQANDKALSGITLNSTLIDLNTTGILRDAAFNNAELDFSAYTPVDLSNITINKSSITITSITAMADASYVETDDMDIVVNYSGNAIVTGSPRISMDIGGTPVFLDYLSGSGSAALTFRYTVATGLNDNDGVQISSPIDENGGVIKDGSNLFIVPDFTAPVTNLVFVDSIDPTLTLDTPSNILANNFTNYSLSGTCSENTLLVNVTLGSLTTSATCTAAVWSITNWDTTAEADAQGITLTIDHADAAGNTVTVSTTIDKDSIAPTIALINPADLSSINSGNDSAVFAVNGTCDENTAVVNIQVDTIDASSQVGFVCDGTNFSGTIDTTGLIAGTYSFTATISDAAGNEVTTAINSVTKDTTPPTVEITSPLTATYINISNDSAVFAVSGTCNDNTSTAVIKVDGVAAASPVGFVCDGTNFSGTIDTTGISEGAFVLTAELTDAALNTATSSDINITKDSVAPAVALVTPADLSSITALSDSATFAVDGTCDENGATVDIQVDGVSTTSQVGLVCNGTNFSGTIDTTPLAVGSLDFTAVISDAAGNETTTNINTITKDTTPPSVEITSPLTATYINISNDSAVFAVSGTCNENTLTVVIKVDGVAAASPAGFVCDGTNFSGTIDTTGISEGSFILTAELTDAALNTATSSDINITKDSVAPVIALVTPADLSSITALNDSATFAVDGTCDENTAVVNIQVDAVDASSQVGFVCDGTNFSGTIDTTSLSTGALSFTAVIIDVAGNETTSTSNTVTKDSTPPSIAITNISDGSFINSSTNSATFTISGTCNEASATANILIDAVAASSQVGFVCDGTNFSGTIDSTAITDSTFAITAEITDPSLNKGTSAALNITKDTVLPAASFATPADLTIIGASEDSATYAVNGTCDENGQTISIEIDAMAAASQVGFVCDGTNFSGTIDTTGIASGTYAFTAIISDAAGNSFTTAANNITKDATPPAVAITTPADSSFVNIASDSALFAVSGTCDENGETVVVKIDGTPATAPTGFICDGTNFSGTISTLTISEGSFDLTAELTDSSSNTGTSSANTIIKDTVAPIVAIDVLGNILQANVTNYTVTGTCDGGAGSIDISVGTESASGSCSGGTYSVSVNATSLSDGTGIAVLVDHEDDAGNSATQASTSVDKDTIAPTVSISYSPDITLANQNSYSVAGSCNENGETVTVSIDGLSFTPTCSSGSWSVNNQDVSSRADNANLLITANISDPAGNSALTASATVDKTTATPTVTISNPADITQANATYYIITGTCSQNGSIVSVSVGSISITPNCSSGTWSTVPLDVTTLPDGTVNITADHTTAPQATDSVNKDTSSSTVTISSAPNITSSNESNYIASGTCSDDGTNVDVNIDTENFLVSCNSGSWTTGMVDVSAITDGVGLMVTVDHATATQASKTINKVTGTPTVSNLSVATTLSDVASLAFESENPGGAFTINDYIINYRVKGSPTWLVYNDGVNTNIFPDVDGLTHSTFYEFRVAAVYDTTEQTEWSNTAEGETQPLNIIFGPHTAMNVGGATQSTVIAHEDSTAVTLNGAPLITLNKGQTHTFTSAQFDYIDADKPIYTSGKRGNTANVATSANVVWNPTAWSGKIFSFNATRTNPQVLEVFAVEDTYIEVKQGATVLDSATVTAGSGTTLTWSVYGSYQVTSTGTMLAFHLSTGSGKTHDPKPLIPGYTQIIGFPSRSMRLTTASNATNYNLIHSNSSTASGSLNKADSIVVTPQGGTTSLYQSESLLINADKKISGASFADSNGLCAGAFMSTNLLRTKYALPVNSDYIAFASKLAGTIEVRDPSNNLVTTLTLSRSGGNSSAPFKVRMANPTAGYRYIATVPVAAWYQPNVTVGAAPQDETLMYGTNE